MSNHTTPLPEAPIFEEGALADRRVKILRQYEILDTEPEAAFDRLTDLAAEAFDVEVSFVAFLDTDRQWFKSSVGLSRKETDLAGTFCTHTIEEGDLLVIGDAFEDERTAGSPFVTEAGLRFYAGVPLRAPCGTAIGTFSIMDPEPRGLSGQERERLQALAQMVMEGLERRREARRSEQVARRFEAVLEDPNMLAGVLAPGGRLLEANETALGYIEESEEEVTGELFWETPWWPEEVSSQIKENVARAAEGEYVEYEADLTDAEGRPYSVEGAIRPVRGEGQETEALVVSARDVTERKRREEELRRARRQYRAVFEDPGIMVGLLGPDGTVLDINQTALTHVDRSLDEVEGERFWETPWFEGDAALQEEVRMWIRGAAEGEYVEFEADLTEAVGKPLVVEGAVRPVTDEEGTVTSLLISDRDVTEKRKQQAELRRKKSLLEQTQRMAGAWEVDLPTGDVAWSDKVYEIHEMEPGSEIDLETGLGFYVPESREKLKEATEALVEEGTPYDLEVQIITAEDNRRWVRTVGAPVEKRAGEATKVAGAVQDITNRKEEERRRKQVIRRVTDAIVEVDSGWRFTLVNEQAEELYDMAEEDLLGKEFWEVFTGAIGTRLEEEYRGVMNTREPVRLVEHYPELDGWFDIQVYPNEDGGIAFYFEEVTEQKKRERRLNAVFNQTYQFTGLMEPDGTLIEANDTALKFGGVDEEDVLGRPLWDTFWFEGEESRQQKVKSAVVRARDGEFVRHELEVRGAEEDRIIDFSLRPITDELGNVTMIVPEGRDITEREQGRRRLERYRKYTSRMLDAIDDLFFTLGEDAQLERWNRRFSEVTGYTDKEIDQMSALELVPEGHRERVATEVQRAFSTGNGQVEVPLLRKDGSTVPYEFIGNAVEDPTGDVRVVIVGRDISERLERERELERQNDLFGKAQEIANVGAWEYDAETDTTHWTQEVYHIHERSSEKRPEPEEVISYYHQDDRPDLREAFRRALEEGEPYDLELRIWTEAGDRRWVRTRGEPQHEGDNGEEKVARVRGAIQDITERKERERELRQAETLFENAQDALFLIDVERENGGTTFRIQRVNPAYEEETGLSREEVEGHLPRDIVGEKQGEWIEKQYRECVRRQEPLEYEEELPIDGTTYWQTRIAPVVVEGSVEKIVGSTRDVTERKRRTRKLERYERIVENLPVGAFRTTVSGEFVELNEALTEIFGASEQQLREAGTEALYADPTGREELVETLQKQQSVEGRLVQMQTLAGEERWIRATITLIEEDGTRYLDGIVQDVTGERWRKEKLERQNDLFERSQQIADVGAWEYDLQSETLTLTDQALFVLGFDPGDEVSLAQSYDHCHPEDRREAMEAFRRSVDTDEPYDIEVRVLGEGGGVRWVRCRGEPQDRPTGQEAARLRGTLQDITDQKERERALRERREKIGKLFEATRRLLTAESRGTVADRIHEALDEVIDCPFIHVGLVSEGVIVPQTTAAEELSREPETEPQPASEDLVVTRALRAEEAVVVEDTGTLDNNVDYGSLTSLAGIPIGDRGAVVVGTEQTEEFDRFDLHLVEVMARYAALVLERLGREEALREAKEEAEEAARLKTAVLANMSHEIRTPLTPVIGFAESLAEDLAGPEAQVAERIKRSSQRLQQTLDSVLRLAQLEAGTFDLDREEIDLRAVVREVLNRINSTAEEKGLTLETDLPSHPVRGRLSEGGVRRIVENLLENAVKFTPKGGRVEVRLREANGTAVLEVEDTGIGICEEAQAEVFEAFEQESEGLGREYEGTGLGLSVVRRLAEVHGGTVGLESEKGEGSRFTVRLPATERSEEPTRAKNDQ